VADLLREGDELVVDMRGIEKAEAVHGEVRVPVSAVTGVEVNDDVIHRVRGLKAPGSAWPGLFAMGTFYAKAGKGGKMFALVHHNTPRGLVVRLENTNFDTLVIGLEDPEATKAKLRLST
jgi:hypothetical protein